MKPKAFPLASLLMIPALLACGLTNTVTNTVSNAVTGGESYKPAAELWSDVPKMDGLTPSAMEDLPLPVKLLMRTVLANLGQNASELGDRSIDWISYDFSGTPDDVSSFYTNDKMSADGWESDSGNSCASGGAAQVPGSGVFCAFQKTENGTQRMLAIISTQEDASKPTGVFFLRLEGPASQ